MKTVLITGASDGFGKAIAQRLAKQKMNLILTARSGDKLEILKNELLQLGAPIVHNLVFDVRDLKACETAINSIPENLQDIDVLVNNAGLASGLDPIHTGDIEDWEKMIDTNVKGLLYITRLISPRMVERKSGHIINMGSIASREVYTNGNVYCASKHAVLALSQGMRMDLLPHCVKVSHISPGAAETNFSNVRFHGDTDRAKKVYDGYKPLVADDIANVVEYLISLPPHVCLNEVNITCTSQFNGVFNKK